MVTTLIIHRQNLYSECEDNLKSLFMVTDCERAALDTFIEHRELSFGYSELVSCHRIHASKCFQPSGSAHRWPSHLGLRGTARITDPAAARRRAACDKASQSAGDGPEGGPLLRCVRRGSPDSPYRWAAPTTVCAEVMMFMGGNTKLHSRDQVAFRNLAWLSNLFGGERWSFYGLSWQ